MCVHYSRVAPVKFIIVSSPLPQQAIVCTELSWQQTFSPSTQTRTLIPVFSVDEARHGGVKVGSNNLGGGNAFDSMPTARPFYWPQQQQTCWHRLPLNGHGTVLVDEDLYVCFLSDHCLTLGVYVTLHLVLIFYTSPAIGKHIHKEPNYDYYY
jgi:hypothetical protein